jgi:hypothetical protein
LTVSDGDDGVVEGGVNVSDAFGNVLFDLLANFSSSLSHVLSLLLLASDSLARALAGTSIGTGTLTTARQALAMAQATIATKVHQTLDVHRDFTTQVTLDRELGYLVTQTFHVCIGDIFDLRVTTDTRSVTDFLCAGPTHTIDRGQSDLCVLMVRNVNPSNPGHGITPKKRNLNIDGSCDPTRADAGYPLGLTLTLLVARVTTDHAHNTVATNDLAVTANALYRCQHFHV